MPNKTYNYWWSEFLKTDQCIQLITGTCKLDFALNTSENIDSMQHDFSDKLRKENDDFLSFSLCSFQLLGEYYHSTVLA